VYAALAVAIVGGMLGVSFLLGERHGERATDEPYESGILATDSARVRFPAHFYLIAMFFVVFDLEAVFLYAWALTARQVGWRGFAEAAVFVGVLLAGLAYLWRAGALDIRPGTPADRRAGRRP